MIQPAALPAVPGLLPLGEALPAPAAETLEMADFGALLTIKSEELVQPGLAPKLPVAALPTQPAPLPEAAVLPEDGKPLPVAVSKARTTLLPGASEAPDPVTIEPTAGPRRERSEEPLRAELPIAAPHAQLPAPVPALAASDVTAPQAEQPIPVNPSPVPVPVPRGALEAPSPAPVALTPPHQPLSAPIDLAERRQPARTARTNVSLVPAPVTLSVITVPALPASQIGEPQLRLSLPDNGAPQTSDSAKPPVGALRPQMALPAAVTAERRPATSKTAAITAPELASLVAEPVAPAVTLTAPTPALPASPAITPADPALRPHDFTQLVDRLVAARELAAPQAFQVAIEHGEFGRVQLRFRQDSDGLNVALASTDPEFARVVSAAPAPVLAVLPVETPAQTGQRSDSQSQSAATSGGSSQQRGASPERREDRHGPESNPVPLRQGAGRGSRRSGIFA
jgi:hypothetical protein